VLQALGASGQPEEQQPVASTSGVQAQQARTHYAYARKPEGKNYVNPEHIANFGQNQLADYLIKTVPRFITMVRSSFDGPS
jgi:hypothetical protein